MLAAFHHIALNCRDIDATEAWYSRHFGFVRGRSIPLGDMKIVFIHLGDFYLELFQAGASDPVPGQGDGPSTAGLIRHLAIKVDDVDAVLAGMGEEAHVTLGPLDFDAFIPGWRTAWVVDPDGVIVEISQGYVDG
jgi:glyoxylase I family protein